MTKARDTKTSDPKPWPELKQPFTNDLIDAILREMSDAELDALIVRHKATVFRSSAKRRKTR